MAVSPWLMVYFFTGGETGSGSISCSGDSAGSGSAAGCSTTGFGASGERFLKVPDSTEACTSDTVRSRPFSRASV